MIMITIMIITCLQEEKGEEQVFSVTPFKIDQNKNQNCSKDKVIIIAKRAAKRLRNVTHFTRAKHITAQNEKPKKYQTRANRAH